MTRTQFEKKGSQSSKLNPWIADNRSLNSYTTRCIQEAEATERDPSLAAKDKPEDIGSLDTTDVVKPRLPRENIARTKMPNTMDFEALGFRR